MNKAVPSMNPSFFGQWDRWYPESSNHGLSLSQNWHEFGANIPILSKKPGLKFGKKGPPCTSEPSHKRGSRAWNMGRKGLWKGGERGSAEAFGQSIVIRTLKCTHLVYPVSLVMQSSYLSENLCGCVWKCPFRQVHRTWVHTLTSRYGANTCNPWPGQVLRHHMANMLETPSPLPVTGHIFLLK